MQEPKIQANLTFADGSERERAELLRSSSSALERVIILRSRDDYAKMVATTSIPDALTPPVQAGLL